MNQASPASRHQTLVVLSELFHDPTRYCTIGQRNAPKAGGDQLDDRFREPGIRGTGSVLVDSSFEFV